MPGSRFSRVADRAGFVDFFAGQADVGGRRFPGIPLVAVVREAASRVYKTDSVNRGEAGELLLHVACRQEFGTQQLVARLYYKSALDQQVHGFDCVHFRMGFGQKIELWLGESKLYSSAADA